VILRKEKQLVKMPVLLGMVFRSSYTTVVAAQVLTASSSGSGGKAASTSSVSSVANDTVSTNVVEVVKEELL
jgi:hypothetical protein